MPKEFPNQMWNAIAQAETGSFPNKFIRTTSRPAGGSTAYGPVQLTGTTAADYAKRGLLSPESLQFYNTKMKPMYDAFARFGNEPRRAGYDKKFDYGGAGTLDPINDFAGYDAVTTDVMRAMWNQANGDPERFIELWRGKPRSQDPRYFDTVMQQFRSS